MESVPLHIKPQVSRESVEAVVIHFAGDSGDGMQITGSQFTSVSAKAGNDIQTFPDFPAEIRAPAGTVPGVSGFQLRFSEHVIYTPGDRADVLVAMNPAALKTALPGLKRGGVLIIDEDKFTLKDFKKAGVSDNPLEGDALSAYTVVRVPLTHLALSAVEECGLGRAQSRKCKNMFVLGVLYWLYDRRLADTVDWLKEKFQKNIPVAHANIIALKAGYDYAIATELFQTHYRVEPAPFKPGHYRQLSGNQALALGCVAAASLSEKPVLLAGYPITPASDILHIAARYGDQGVKVFQAEDEMAAIGAAIGAAYGGHLAITCTSGPGFDLKAEAMGLAVITELPLVIINVQRAGPSTGMPTKVEQSDLLAAVYGRHGECPIPVFAPSTPGEAFEQFLEACRIAQRYMTPVIILSDAYLANNSEPWKIPDVSTLPSLKPTYCTEPEGWQPYQRDPKTLARPWVVPGTPEMMHRIGGLEKAHESGAISYDADNHERMVNLRANKIANITTELPPAFLLGDKHGELLVISWGSVYGAARSAVESLRADGQAVTLLHMKCLWPLPANLKTLFSSFKRVVTVELNSGQLSTLLRAETLVDINAITQITGRPFHVDDLVEKLCAYCPQEVLA